MKSLCRIITALAILNLTVTGLTLAQAVSTPPESAPAPTTPEPAQVEAAKSTGEKSLSKLSKNLAELRFNFANPFSHGGAGTVLVIPTTEIKAEDLAAITEDMTVMSRIIDKQLGQEESGPPSWIYGHFIGQSTMTETMYLQGYGALFLKKVDFPLSPTQQVQEEEQPKKEEGADPVWEQMKKDIYEPQEERKRREKRPEEKYDAEKVETLKTNIIKALKHAANIRSLKPDESVIATVSGSGSSYGDYVSGSIMRSIPGTGQVVVQNKDRRTMSIITPSLPAGLGFSSSTVLIIRAKKSDIDAFAKDDLDLDTFRQRVQIYTYAPLTEGLEAGNAEIF
jgi:hypothetical protein